MNRFIKLSQAISYILIALAILVSVLVWPLKLVHRGAVSRSDEIFQTESGECSDEHMIAQVFVSKGTELESVDVYVCSDSVGEDICLTIYDGNLDKIYDKTMTISAKQALPGMVRIPVSMNIERGAAYILSVAGKTAPIIVGLEDHATTSNGDVFAITYDGMEDPDHNIIIRYNYYIEFTVWQIVVIDLLIALVTIGLIFVSRKAIIACDKDREIQVQKVLQYVLNPIIIVITLILLYLVFPAKLFSSLAVNWVFWDLGIIITSALALYAVNYKRKDDKPLVSLEFIKANYQGWITSIFIAHMLWYCSEYMNGLYELHHIYAVRRMLICFLLAIISTYKKNEICRIINIIWAVAGIPLMYFYAKPYVGTGEDEVTYKLNAYIIYFGIFVVINIVASIVGVIRKKISVATIRWSYAISFAILFIGACVLANTREWPGLLSAMVAIMVLRIVVWDKRDRWLEYLCNGVIFNFIFMVIFSLLHRPYYGFIYYRYDMCYMTVTMTATHLTLCLAACAVKIYEKNKVCEDKRQLLPWIVLFGVASNYQLMTLSRTGYVSVAIMIITCLIISAIVTGIKGERVYETFKNALVLLIAALVMFLPTTTITRIIPPLYDEPVIYEYEPHMVTIYKGTPADYEYYMDWPRFVEVFSSKVLGIGDATASVDRECLPIRYKEYPVIGEYAYSGSSMIMPSYESADIELEEPEDLSNGRIDIYKSYIDQLNLWGHESMGAILKDGSEASHAHNVILQIMFDHGIVYGIYFTVFMIWSFIIAVINYRKENYRFSILIIALIVGFMSAGLVEWIYHVCNPFGLTLILALSTMILDESERAK